jgi:hypothetical protein
MSHRATRSELEQFGVDGFFVREAVFTREEVEELQQAVEQVDRRIHELADPTGRGVTRIEGKRYEWVLESKVKWDWAERSSTIRSMEPFHHLDPRLDALVDDPRLWQPTLDLIHCDAVGLFTDKLNFKRPGGSPFPWHQDSPYWAFECDQLDRLVSVGLYLDDADRENGCLWVIPGSHLQGILPGLKDEGLLAKLYTDLDALEAPHPVPVEAPAGTAIFFHADIVHGSESNESPASRRAVFFTYQPAGLPRWQLDEPRVPLAEREKGRPQP